MRWPDIEAAVRIEEQVFTHHPWSAESFWGELSDTETNSYLVASAGGVLYGYAGIAIDDDAHLHTIAVAPNVSRHGIARRMLAELLSIAERRRCKRMLLEVSEHNQAALELYRSAGFTELAVRTNYYGPTDSALVLAKQLLVAT